MNGDGSQQLRMLDHALSYAELGLRVFPLFEQRDGVCACLDGPACNRPGKHPRISRWQDHATCDETTIRAWWARNPHSGIAVATGAGSGVVVIDLDGPEGRASFAALESQHGAIGLTPESKTARGDHIWCAHPGTPVKTVARVAPGVDVRGDGGFVVVPPTRHASGVEYAWLPGQRYGAIPCVAFPAWMPTEQQPATGGAVSTAPSETREADRRDAYVRAALDAESKAVRTAPEGARNVSLNRAAFKLAQFVASGALDVSVLRSELASAARAVGLDDLETHRTIKSGLDAGLKKGRDVPPPVAGNGGSPPPAATASAAPAANLITWVGTSQIFAKLYPPRWVARGLHIGPGRPTLIAGYGASAKTLSAQAMALAKAAGRPIWDHFECEAGIVLHLDYEQGLYATAKRYQRLALGHGIASSELGNRLRLAALPSLMLDDPKAYDAVCFAADGVELVIIDALRGSAPRQDENDSSVRSVLDMLNRSSNATGAAFMMLHHAGKPKDSHGSDARTLARGSSAIFDACGCVLNFVAGETGAQPKRVSQVKTPAEAEGVGLEPFLLTVEDVALDGNPTAGVRATWTGVKRASEIERADNAYERDTQRLLATISAHPNTSSNGLVERSGMGRQRALSLLGVLVDEGKLRVVAGHRGAKQYQLTASQEGSET